MNQTSKVERRAVGTAAASLAFGSMDFSDYDDASATTLKGNLDMGIIPASAWGAGGVS